MATAIKRCRVCGKSYEACHTAKNVAGVFRWQEVACSPECGSIYLAQIKASRGLTPTQDKVVDSSKDVEAVANYTTKLIYDEEHEIYENELIEYFDDAEDTAVQ